MLEALLKIAQPINPSTSPVKPDPTLSDRLKALDEKKDQGDWQVSSHEPEWQKNRYGQYYQCVWQPSTKRRGFLGRDDFIYFDQELEVGMPTWTSDHGEYTRKLNEALQQKKLN